MRVAEEHETEEVHVQSQNCEAFVSAEDMIMALRVLLVLTSVVA